MAKEKSEMTFLEHLEELRWHIVRSLIAICALSLVAFLCKKIIFDDILLAPRQSDFFTNQLLCQLSSWLSGHLPAWMAWLHPETICINTKPLKIISIDMSGQFSTHITISIVAGFIVASPYVIYQFWSFIAPALHGNERKNARGAVLIISALFIVGVFFGYYVITPFSVDFLGTYTVSDQVENTISLNSYFSTVASVTLASGISFELPVLAYFLARIGILSAGFMRKYRKHSIIIILIVAAIITPPDAFSQILVTIPLFLLYEASIFIVAAVNRNRQRKAAE
jgi:sec-independent protein translocase protein TatC